MKLRNINTKLLYIGIALSIFSQIPSFWNNRYISLGYTGALFFVFLISIYKDNLKIKLPIGIIALPVLIDLILIVLSIFSRKNYLQSNLFVPINMCCFFTIIGYYCGKFTNIDTLRKINRIIVYSTLIMALFIFKDSFVGVDWANASGYLYTAKNSAATIFLSAIIIILIYIQDFKRPFAIAAVFFLSSLIIMTKSRATIICLFIFLLYITFFYIKNYKLKIILITFIILIGIVIFTNKISYDFFINNIFFNNRSKTDFSVITSGRDVQYDYFFKIFPAHWIIGTGGTYIECNPMTILLSFGIVGGVPTLIYSILPIIYTVKNKIRNVDNYTYKIRYLVLSLAIVLFINGLFEELTPFGPGVKCFVLWFYLGVYIRFYKIKGGKNDK